MRFEHWIYTSPLRLRSLFRRELVDADLEEELRNHVEWQTEENIARGMSKDAAHRAALIAIGGVEQQKQQCREARGFSWVDDLIRDLVYGWRSLRRSPGFAITALLILALGIGANTAILSADHALLFRKLPYTNSGRLVDVFQAEISDPAARMTVAPANYLDWQAEKRLFESFAAWQTTSLNLSGGDDPERVRAASVSGNLFSVLGVEPMLGRTFQTGENAPGAGQLVILSYELWQRRFGGNRAAVGKTIRANDRTWTIIGVMPPDFRFPIGWVSTDVEAWVPLVLTPQEWTSRTNISLMVIARMRAGVTIAQAQSEMDGVARHLAQRYPEADKQWGVHVSSMSDAGVGDFRELFELLSASVGLVLLIACVNVANLLLARGLARQQELTIRMALGARTSRIVRQLITEGVLLSMCGGMLGIGLGYVGIRVMALLTPPELRDLKHMTLDTPVLLLSLILAILTGLLFSILPALALSRLTLRGTMQQSGRNHTGTLRSSRLKALLVSGEIAFTLVLLFCAGDILKSFFTYMRVDPGFEMRNVLTMHMALPEEKYRSPQQWASFFNRAAEEIQTVPGVVAAAAGSGAPMEGTGSILRFHVEGGRVTPGMASRGILEHVSVTPNYFRVTGMTMMRGREILASDQTNTPPVAVVNETLARKWFGDANPVGRRIFLDGDVNESAVTKTTGPSLEIVGVVRDIKEYGLSQITPQMMYVPLAQNPESSASLLVKTTVSPVATLPAIRERVAKLDPDQPIYKVESLQEIFWSEHAFFRFNTLLLSVFAGMALVLSLIGIYGVVSYEVNQRTREFGIRLILGSTRQRILLLVLRDAAWMAGSGIGVGVALAWPAVRLLTRTLHQSMFLTLIQTGPCFFPMLCAAILVTLLIASLVPAQSAMRADPMQALRYE